MEATRHPPVAVCTRCGDSRYDAESVNQRCTREPDGKPCGGVYRAARGKNAWKECSTCGGSGNPGSRDRHIGATRGASCQGSGWLFVGGCDSECVADQTTTTQQQ